MTLKMVWSTALSQKLMPDINFELSGMNLMKIGYYISNEWSR